jgi:Dyp-type peroxidase family
MSGELTKLGESDLQVIQGAVARNFEDMHHVCHVVLRVSNPASAREFIGAMKAKVTTASCTLGDICLNIGFTFHGLRALGLDTECKTLAQSAELQAFVQGAPDRAALIGDTGQNPRMWKDGLGRPENVHVLFSVWGKTKPELAGEIENLVVSSSSAFEVVSRNPGEHLENGRIHFGYVDGISQPKIEGLPFRQAEDGQPPSRSGAFVLGYESQFDQHTYKFDFPEELGRNGTFGVFRIMQQDVHGFEEFLTREAGPGGNRELVAAKLCGRWRDGTPLTLSPNEPQNNPVNAFDYTEDPDGKACPFSAHARRAHPRMDPVAGNARNKHRIVRSSMPYGPPYEGVQDGKERGLVGLFLCANIGEQFEFIMKNWISRGFHGRLPMENTDPLIGIHSFVSTRGSAYCFFPSLNGLEYIASGGS